MLLCLCVFRNAPLLLFPHGRENPLEGRFPLLRWEMHRQKLLTARNIDDVLFLISPSPRRVVTGNGRHGKPKMSTHCPIKVFIFGTLQRNNSFDRPPPYLQQFDAAHQDDSCHLLCLPLLFHFRLRRCEHCSGGCRSRKRWIDEGARVHLHQGGPQVEARQGVLPVLPD